MTRDAILKRIYHKLVSTGECVLESPESRHYPFVRIVYNKTYTAEDLAEDIQNGVIVFDDAMKGGFYCIYAEPYTREKMRLRTLAPELGELTPWLRRHFAEIGAQGTDKDHEIWENALGV